MSDVSAFGEPLRLSFDEDERGWIIYAGDVPIGFTYEDGKIVTPSGAEYAVTPTADGFTLCAPDKDPSVVYRGGAQPGIRDTASGVAWELKPDWLQEALAGMPSFQVEEAFAKEYTLEDAQGTMPGRVKLLLAALVVKDLA